MSNYRNYGTPWNKPTTSSIPTINYPTSSKKDTPASTTTTTKYDSTFGRSRSDKNKTPEDNKTTTSRIAAKYGTYQHTTPVTSYRTPKPIDKKELSHPPVSYRGLTRTSTRSRDPSPEKSTSSSSYGYNNNRLYPRSYTRSVSRELDNTTTIPKYSGRSSLSKDDSRSSREDLSSTSQKYINSRFLPKNSVEKSYTAYTRPSTIRSHETSRKNRELLSVLHAQQQQRSRPASRCSTTSSKSEAVKEETVEIAKCADKESSGGLSTRTTPWSSFLDMKFSSPNDVSNKSSSKSTSDKSKSGSKKALPPIPKHSTNKDFRKSVLNMNPDGTTKKVGRRSTSVSSAESEAEIQQSEVAADISENSTAHKPSKLPKRSPSSSNSSTDIDEAKRKNETEAKSFLMRALAPVTNLFKTNKFPEEKVNWMDSTDTEPPLPPLPKPAALFKRVSSGEKAWWLDDNNSTSISTSLPRDDEEPDQTTENIMEEEYQNLHKLRHIDSGERSWWLTSSENIPAMVEAEDCCVVEKPKYAIRHQESGEKAWWLASEPPLGDRASPEGLEMPKEEEVKKPQLFISRHRNIDEILGGGSVQMWSPLMDKVFNYSSQENSQTEAKSSYGKLDDAALQLYKDGDYGSYLDLEASISEQQEEFEGFQSNKKNSIVLRTQLSVRVHTIIEKLLTSEGRELRRALFSLKQIFQEDKDLVHEFVQNDGLSCLIKVGSEADQNYQNYILRALGQVMLYVDGMNGVIEHNQTIQWLYSLISSKFRLVVKTALKLLLVFVEYTETNCLLLIKAIHTLDYTHGVPPWYNIMKLLKDFDSADTELLIYATTLINKVLNGVPDQDTYYDQTDALEEQDIEHIIQRYMSKPGTDLDLLQQFQIYEAVLQYEDGEDFGGMPFRHLDESIRKTLRNRKAVSEASERRKSRRHSTGTAPMKNNVVRLKTSDDDGESSSSSSHNSEVQINGCYKDSNKAADAGVTPALRRRRERAERQRSFMREQQESVALLKNHTSQHGEDQNENDIGNYPNTLRLSNGLHRSKDLTPLLNAVNKMDSEQPWILNSENENERNTLLNLKRENTVKDLTQKLANQNILHSPTSDEKSTNNRIIGDMSGLISKAKEGLAKSKSKADVMIKSTGESSPLKTIEVKKSENELKWEELIANLDRPLNLCDMDFTDLLSEDEGDVLAPATVVNGIPPPPPPLLRDNVAPPPPPLASSAVPPVFGVNLQRLKMNTETKIPIKKTKKTVKLFWKEVRDDPICHVKLKTGYIWDELKPVVVDTQKLEHLFESRAKDLITKKQQEMNKNKEIIVLDPKRSNAINIGMTKLPPPRSIKTAILKMDATIMNREGIEKLLTMLPTEEERSKIQEAQAANPDLPLGSAEQFLLTLASISELPARLKLWAFKLDFENSEREIAEPLMDLKQGFEVLKVNKTFRGILSTLLSIGNFLNGNEVKGFQIDYLAKVPEVKDTVHKHSLLHHLCHIVMEKFPDATDLYSEIGAITRASKVDFDELALNIQRLEFDCKASWDHLKLIAKHDGSTMKVKMSDFLADCAERIILVGIIHRRITNRFHKFLLWLGIPLHQIAETKPNEFCRIVSEFALEYRTTRERVLQQLEKKANHRERNKTRGKMITDIGKFRTKEDRADAELRQLLGSDISDVESMQGTLPWRRTRRVFNQTNINGNLTDGDDEIFESLVKTATKGTSRTAPRERKRTRHADRKSLRRTLKNGLSEEEKKHLTAYIKGY